MKAIETTVVRKPTEEIDDRATVRMGSMSPSFPTVTRAASDIGDLKKIRLGSMSPAFPPVRTA